KNREVKDLRVPLGKELTSRIQAAARQGEVTANTLIQAAWALVLSKHAGNPDIVFGVTVAGRPTHLKDIDTVVGLFIQSIPLRVQVDSKRDVSSWLKQVVAKNALIRQHEVLPLTEITRASQVKGPLFHSLFVFENAPFDASVARDGELVLAE